MDEPYRVVVPGDWRYADTDTDTGLRDRVLAEIYELRESTGDPTYLAAFEERVRSGAKVHSLGHLSIADPDDRATYLQHQIAAFKTLAAGTNPEDAGLVELDPE